MQNPSNNIDQGREAIKYFHNQAVLNRDYNYNFDQVLDLIGGGGKKTSIFLDGFGFAISNVQNGYFDSSDIKKAMESLADKSDGKIPDQNSFFNAISNSASNPSFLTAASFTAVETAKTVGNGIVEVGNVAIDTLSSLKNILPIVIVGGVIYFLWSKTKRLSQ